MHPRIHCMLALIDLLRFGLLSHWSLYLLNSGYLVVIAVSSCSSSLYQFFPSNIKKSLRQFTCDLKQGLQLVSQLLLLIMDPLISPLLWLLNFGNWGEPERAPHRREVHARILYVCLVRPSPARRLIQNLLAA